MDYSFSNFFVNFLSFSGKNITASKRTENKPLKPRETSSGLAVICVMCSINNAFTILYKVKVKFATIVPYVKNPVFVAINSRFYATNRR